MLCLLGCRKNILDVMMIERKKIKRIKKKKNMIRSEIRRIRKINMKGMIIMIRRGQKNMISMNEERRRVRSIRRSIVIGRMNVVGNEVIGMMI